MALTILPTGFFSYSILVNKFLNFVLEGLIQSCCRAKMSTYSQLWSWTQWDSRRTDVAAHAYLMAQDKVKEKKNIEHLSRNKNPFLRENMF